MISPWSVTTTNFKLNMTKTKELAFFKKKKHNIHYTPLTDLSVEIPTYNLLFFKALTGTWPFTGTAKALNIPADQSLHKEEEEGWKDFGTSCIFPSKVLILKVKRRLLATKYVICMTAPNTAKWPQEWRKNDKIGCCPKHDFFFVCFFFLMCYLCSLFLSCLSCFLLPHVLCLYAGEPKRKKGNKAPWNA